MTATTHRDANGRFAAGARSGSFGKIAGAATAGLAIGVLAMLGRKAAVQAPGVLAGNWADALAAEHQAILKTFDAIEATDARNTTRRAILLAQLKHTMTKHMIAEENAVYPALREAGRGTEADALHREHGYLKQFLYELGNMPNGSPDYLAKVRRFRADLEAHMTEEETRLFPALRAELSESANRALTTAVNREGFKLA